MPMSHEDVRQIKEAKTLAKQHGLFVVEKSGRFLLYRECKPKNAYIGYRSTPADLHRMVAQAAATKTASGAQQ